VVLGNTTSADLIEIGHVGLKRFVNNFLNLQKRMIYFIK